MSITTALFLARIGVAVVVAVRHMSAHNSSERAGIEPYFDMADGSSCDTSFLVIPLDMLKITRSASTVAGTMMPVAILVAMAIAVVATTKASCN